MTPKQEAFVMEYLIDLNATQACIRAGYSEKTAGRIGAENLQKPVIQAEIALAMAARAKRTLISADDVVRDLQTIAQADARELTEFRRLCCRYCFGAGFRYQRTAGEMETDREKWELLPAKRRAGKQFDEKGGIGYHGKKEPNRSCPECFGDGVGNVHINDTRKLSPAAARLFAGVKRTKDGLEVMTRDQDNALINVGRHLGVFKDRLEIKDVSDRAALMRKKREARAAGNG